MVIASFPAGPLAANCYVLAAAPGAGCVIIDPGMEAVAGLEQVMDDQDLDPAGILLTHGHLDHVASAAEIADRYGVGCWLGPADRPWLTDPMAALTADFEPLVRPYLIDGALREPATMLEPATDAGGRQTLTVADLEFELIPAPGHTPGSTLLRTRLVDGDRGHDVVFSGDVLFEGSVGRTDLPGGDPAAMERTLGTTVLSLADDVVVLPGHGRQTTIGRERATNPFLPRAS